MLRASRRWGQLLLAVSAVLTLSAADCDGWAAGPPQNCYPTQALGDVVEVRIIEPTSVTWLGAAGPSCRSRDLLGPGTVRFELVSRSAGPMGGCIGYRARPLTDIGSVVVSDPGRDSAGLFRTSGTLGADLWILTVWAATTGAPPYGVPYASSAMPPVVVERSIQSFTPSTYCRDLWAAEIDLVTAGSGDAGR